MHRMLSALAAASVALSSSAALAGGDPVEGRKIAETVCVACHGLDGNSTDPQYPRLAGQYADYLTKALSDYKSGARQNPIMAGFAAQLGDAQRANVAAWYASQKSELHTLELTR